MKKHIPKLILALLAFAVWLTTGDATALLANAPLILPEADFQKKVLDGVEALRGETKTLKTQQETLITNYDNLDKETKKAFEELTKVKNSAADLATTMVSLKKVQDALRMEQRMAYGNPIERLLGDPEKRERINLAVRMAMDNNGDFARRLAPRLKALGEDTSPGSTLINTQLAGEIYDVLAMYGSWNTLGVRRLGTKTTTYPIKTVRPVANFVLTEADTISDDTNKAGTSVDLTVEVIAVLLNVSLQLLQDAEFDVTADVLNDFTEAFNYRLDWAAFAADGTADATDGGNTGIFPFGTEAEAAAGNVTVEATELEDWTRCLTTVSSVVLTRPARWWMHPYILVRALSVKDSNGRPIFLTATEAPTRGGIGSILGYPVTLVEAAPSTNAADSTVAVFGDPQAMVVGVRQDFTFEASDHHKWNTLQRSFRAYGRAGVKGRRATGLATLTLPSA